jgi:hypothetical protein
MENVWCTEKEAVAAAKRKDPGAGLAPCRGPACERFREDYPLCVLMVCAGWPDYLARKA